MCCIPVSKSPNSRRLEGWKSRLRDELT
uniref:Uncharacterized protein n=1 Tax=Anguilla anguilla TaxID=7936 RepID=A0A0E9TKI6_ANGAN